MKMRNNTRTYLPHSGSVTYQRKDDNVKLLNKGDSIACVINQGEEDELICFAFAKSKFRIFFYYVLALFSGCLVILLGYWYPSRYIYVTCKPCSLEEAEFLIVKDTSGESTVCMVKKARVFGKTCSRDRANLLPTAKSRDSQFYRYFMYKCLRYVWEREKKAFVELRGLDRSISIEKLIQKTRGLSPEEREVRLRLFGLNLVDVTVKSYGRILIELTLNPFYIVMLFSSALWFFEGYLILPGVVLVVAAFTLFLGTFHMRRLLQSIHKDIRQSGFVNVLQRQPGNFNKTVKLATEKLVPGDILILNEGDHMYCDAVITSGQCIVAEDYLTGKGRPAHKYALTKDDNTSEKSADLYSIQSHPRQTVYRGSTILHTSSSKPTYAVAVATGFSTCQGRMVKDVLHKSPIVLDQRRGSLMFIMVSALICTCLFFASLYFLLKQKVGNHTIILRALNIVTIAVSPFLSICTTLISIATAWRLQESSIYCTDIRKVAYCGRTNVVCFDKTGTLTKARMSFSHAIPAEKGLFVEPTRNGSPLPNSLFYRAILSCHSLHLSENQVIGDPLDKALFIQTGGKLSAIKDSDSLGISPIITVEGPEKNCVRIWKYFPFHSSLRRMSVVVTEESSRFIYVYTKGSPEVIKHMCTSDSLPNDFHMYLNNLTNAGYHVIAYASKKEEKPRNCFDERIKAITRDEVESQLTFLGFIALENEIKNESEATISCLQKGGVRTVMVTGDNLRTAVAVGKQCQILSEEEAVVEVMASNKNELVFKHIQGVCSITQVVDRKDSGFVAEVEEELDDAEQLLKTGAVCGHSVIEMDTRNFEGSHKISGTSNHQIAVTGNELLAIRDNHPDFYKMILSSGKIFARMSPKQKAILVRDMQAMCLSVCMCGDGENDVMAIKEAEVGISLSNTITAKMTPFNAKATEKATDITCVLRVIAEGRSALVTLSTSFKFLLTCSLITFVSNICLQYFNTELMYPQRAYLLGLAWILSVTMAVEGHPYSELASQRPTARLLDPIFFFSIVTQVVLQGGYFVGLLYFIGHFPWYKAPVHHTYSANESSGRSFQNTFAFTTLGLQFVYLSVILHRGAPFCRRFYHNSRLIIVCVALLVLTSMIMIHPGKFLRNRFLLEEIPDYTTTIAVLIISQGHAFVCFICERQLMGSRFIAKISMRMWRHKASRSDHKTNAAADNGQSSFKTVDSMPS